MNLEFFLPFSSNECSTKSSATSPSPSRATRFQNTYAALFSVSKYFLKPLWHMIFMQTVFADKQQEVDIGSLRVGLAPHEAAGSASTASAAAASSSAATAASASSSLSKSAGGLKEPHAAATASIAASAASIAATTSSASGVPVTGASADATLAEPTSGSKAMSHISGVRRTLSHANSLPAGEITLPKFGVQTEKEPELAEVRIVLFTIS